MYVCNCCLGFLVLELGDSENILFDELPIWLTGALLICYVANRPLTQYGIYKLWKCEVYYSHVY